MKRWALLVAGIYLLILAVLTVPFILLALAPMVTVQNALEAWVQWQYWLWLVIMGLGQFALLSVPVRVIERRPVTRGALWPTVLAGGLMMGALVVGAGYSLVEFFTRLQNLKATHYLLPLGLGLLAWVFWSWLFARAGGTPDTRSWLSRQCRLLLQGSILELLIAVPTHVVARTRDYCCAGFLTFVGLTMGVSVMLFSFGPAVFYLYAARWQRLHPKPAGR